MYWLRSILYLCLEVSSIGKFITLYGDSVLVMAKLQLCIVRTCSWFSMRFMHAVVEALMNSCVIRSLKTDLRFAALKFAGGIERRNVGLTKMLSKVHVS